MDIKLIPPERIEEYKKFVKERIDVYPWSTPSEIALRSFYCGFDEFRFTDARAIAEQTKQIYLQKKK